MTKQVEGRVTEHSAIADQTDVVLELVRAEREDQTAKWGPSCHEPAVWLAILGRQIGHYSAMVLDDDSIQSVEELIQIAAVAVAAAEDIIYGQAL